MSTATAALCLLAALVAAEDGAAPPTLRTVGTLHPRLSAVLGPKLTGTLASVAVQVGDRVVAGQELARIDDANARLEVALRETELAGARARQQVAERAAASVATGLPAAEAELADAGLNLKRAEALVDKPDQSQAAAPRKLLDDARLRHAQAAAGLARLGAARDEAAARVTEAQAGVAAAEAALALARQHLADAGVRAPFDGVVTRRLVDPGAAVASTPPTDLLEVQDASVLHLEFTVGETVAVGLKPGAALSWRLESETALRPAAIHLVFPAVDAATRTVRCRVLVDNADARLRPGSLVRVELPLP